MAAVSDADYKPCLHCGREFHKWVRAKHTRACPLRPEIADALRAALTGPDGCAVTTRQYEAVRGRGLPTHVTLLQLFGSWRAAVLHFGLTPCSDAQGSQCPHCGHRYANVKPHAAKCPQRPGIAAALREALTSCEDGCMASRDEYDAMRTEGLPNGNLLTAHFGGWVNVAAHFGLAMRSREAVNRRRGRGIARGWAARRESLAGGGGGAPADDPLLVGARRVREDYGDGDGLAYYAERSLSNGAVARMLR